MKAFAVLGFLLGLQQAPPASVVEKLDAGHQPFVEEFDASGSARFVTLLSPT